MSSVGKKKKPTFDRAHMITPHRPFLTRTSRQLLDTHDSLRRLLDKCDPGAWVLGKAAVVNLSEVPAIDPGGVLLIYYTAEALFRRGWRGTTVTGKGPAFERVAKQMHHLSLSVEDRNQFPRDPGEYPLRVVTDPNHIVSELNDWTETVQRDTSADEEHVAQWGQQLGEVVTNTFQHSFDQGQARYVYLCGGIVEGKVQLAGLDVGKTIPVTIGPHVEEAVRTKGEGAMIKKACDLGVTAKTTPQNQGYGLHHLLTSVRNNGGGFHIFSRRGLVSLRPQGLFAYNLEKSDRTLNGTLTVVTLRV